MLCSLTFPWPWSLCRSLGHIFMKRKRKKDCWGTQKHTCEMRRNKAEWDVNADFGFDYFDPVCRMFLNVTKYSDMILCSRVTSSAGFMKDQLLFLFSIKLRRHIADVACIFFPSERGHALYFDPLKTLEAARVWCKAKRAVDSEWRGNKTGDEMIVFRGWEWKSGILLAVEG